ncbi:2-amino-4-hydroxy-6-hydroxymethyldihydropteridine diphosphokinase [Magnetovibrio sp.]|uniref:2-amino-4-hydroxy-6- hydroxymethyldihydropteridine diphosphokinase n=1 Tax=Magnetovibrio sp. TaxID=2024836 RepID=UPI002F938F26
MLKSTILIALGANLPSARYGTPAQTIEAALAALDAHPAVRVRRRSRWFESAPVPISDQPWYVNGVCLVDTDLSPRALLDVLHAIEADFGRVRSEKNAPRVLDLDLLAYDDFVTADDQDFDVPHPRMHERAFVLLPLRDVVPGWIHPRTGATLDALIADLSDEQVIRAMEPEHGAQEPYFDDDLDDD